MTERSVPSVNRSIGQIDAKCIVSLQYICVICTKFSARHVLQCVYSDYIFLEILNQYNNPPPSPIKKPALPYLTLDVWNDTALGVRSRPLSPGIVGNIKHNGVFTGMGTVKRYPAVCTALGLCSLLLGGTDHLSTRNGFMIRATRWLELDPVMMAARCLLKNTFQF